MRVFPLATWSWNAVQSNDDFADLLEGAQAIADYIGKNYRQAVYLIASDNGGA